MSTVTRRGFLAGGFASAVVYPAFLRSARAEDGFIELTAKSVETSILGAGAPASTLWGYGGQVPGPLLRARQGETLRIRLHNELPVPTSIHWHGIRIDNAMDGVAGLTQDPVPPGESFEYVFRVPDAGTYWYHAHTKSWEQVARGLYGPLIVDEADALVPQNDDITLVLDDWRLDQQGRFDEASLGSMMDWSHAGRLGNYLTVNGRTVPSIEVSKSRWLRLRMINASNARILEIDPNRFGGEVIAYDGQPIGASRRLDHAPLLLGPAQRVDLLVNFDRAGEVDLEEISGEPFAFVKLAVGDQTSPTDGKPAIPAAALAIPDLEHASTFNLKMEGGAMGQMNQLIYNGRVQMQSDFMINQQVWGFNGVANMSTEPFFAVKQGESVIVTVENRTMFPHAMHTHGHHFRILERNGTTDREMAWRDTFIIGASGTTKIAFVADNPGKWLLHCHMLEHAAAGMMTWFEVA